MKTATLTLFPQSLDRTNAPEAIGSNAARIIENLSLDTGGRLKRRGGLAKVSTPAAVASTNVTACGYFTRRDNVGLLIDYQSATGTLRLTEAPVTNWSDVDDFGARTSAQWYENFNEDGP